MTRAVRKAKKQRQKRVSFCSVCFWEFFWLKSSAVEREEVRQKQLSAANQQRDKRGGGAAVARAENK